MSIFVVKRDGRKERFDKEKIAVAVSKAIDEVVHDNENMEQLILRENIAERVCGCLEGLYTMIDDGICPKNYEIDVEDIQDDVEEEISKINYKVAKAYSIYRNRRTEAREKRNLEKIQKEIIDHFSTRNSNANVDENSFSGKELRILEDTMEQLGLNLLPKYLVERHEKRELYYHDLAKFALGQHNCLQCDYINLLENGFKVGQGDVKPAKHWNSFVQLLAVIVQLQSLQQFGGCSLPYVDTVARKYIEILIANVTEEFFYMYDIEKEVPYRLTFDELHEFTYDYMDDEQEQKIIETVKQRMHQGLQALITNLVTLQSRSGGQLPFSSINVGYDTSKEGLLFTRILLEEIDKGIGRRNKTAIFPIVCFLVKEGVNKHIGDLGFSNYQYAIEVSCRRHYPTFVNGDWDVLPKTDNPYKQHVRMGCRTSLGFDVNANSEDEMYEQIGRGNLAPHTIALSILALKSKKMKENGDNRELLDIFNDELDEALKLVKESLDIRYEIMIKQPPSCAEFMYENGTILDGDKCVDTVEPALKHGTLAVGYISVAEMCKVLFGKYHYEDEKVLQFAVDTVQKMKDKCDEWTKKYKRNYSIYATPAESLCQKVADAIKRDYGVIEGVSDREYVTNSHHVPVWVDINPFTKADIESRFSRMATGGNIFHVEIDGTNLNIVALTELINHAMDMNIPYMRLSHKTCTCLDCGYHKEAFMSKCEECGSENIEELSTVTGYLTKSVNRMNRGKQQEVAQRKIFNS